MLQYIEGDMVALQQTLFEAISDEHKWAEFMHEVTNVIGSGSYTNHVVMFR